MDDLRDDEEELEPEVDDEDMEDTDDDLIIPTKGKKKSKAAPIISDELLDELDEESLDDLAEIEDLEDDGGYDDVDLI